MSSRIVFEVEDFEDILQTLEKPIQKHQDHDQSSHGNWAGKNNFKGNTYYDTLSESFREQGFDDAIDKYSKTFGIDKDGNYFGTNAYEANSVLSYTGDGFANINYYARRLNQSTPTITDGLDEGATANRMINHIDKVIANSPDIFGETTLYRVFSDKVLENLEEGDILQDKGFLSTTRVNITEPNNNNLRAGLSGIKPSPDTVGVIRPSRSKKGKGLAVDLYKALLNEPMGKSLSEKEVLLPRNTSLKFLGYETDNNNTIGPQIAIFERMD